MNVLWVGKVKKVVTEKEKQFIYPGFRMQQDSSRRGNAKFPFK